MKLSELISKIKVKEILGNDNISICSLGFDSRKACKNQLFFAVSGTKTDGHNFIDDAIKQGATAIVCQYFPENINPEICYVKVADSNAATGIIASEFYGNPSSKLKLTGVTGTNGKTTTATLLYQLMKNYGYKSGLISTISNYIDNKKTDATHTTPDAIQLNELLSEMVEAGCDYCFMEVSSHAIAQERIAGLTFAGGIFSNITRDHLDYHGTFEEYIKTKKKFFDDLPPTAFALTNIDDRNGKIMLQNTKAKCKTYALKTIADYKCKILERSFAGMLLNIDGLDVWTKCIGEFNAYNLLAIYATARQLGIDKTETLRLLSDLNPAAGRFECIRANNGITAIVDYAHTPDALENVISAINEMCQNEQLITVVGCGGNRDKGKRPMMAKIASENSNLAILTSDNPRYEKPEDILKDMCDGLTPVTRRKTLVIADRREAIRTAIMMAKPDDVILVAGKGHEPYQEINGVRNHFDDKEIINEIFNEIN
ncbi:MAG: UDP-N-acetylmuramoyl-L-alanyl-D-glutamate--2,6-diaminopimelate ligase [Prevotellaceae bacterium]|jgi:UDP-N-acetylmuramoyl-L-alanyl-D-glutamate--2,6-diaminopimelate ligase|nr:UDP-N-acetylmuramoyl-L-alanyl-D-glutamate--2,6-diaminopimelate ligase [Prevotellaceae bacterium]